MEVMSKTAADIVVSGSKAGLSTPAKPAASASSALCRPAWTELIGAREWEVYQSVLAALRGASHRFMLGGAFGLAFYTGRWRDTKDIDLFVPAQDRERAIQILRGLGFEDYYETLPYDRIAL
jgi:hypothetical protein